MAYVKSVILYLTSTVMGIEGYPLSCHDYPQLAIKGGARVQASLQDRACAAMGLAWWNVPAPPPGAWGGWEPDFAKTDVMGNKKAGPLVLGTRCVLD